MANWGGNRSLLETALEYGEALKYSVTVINVTAFQYLHEVVALLSSSH